MDEPVSALIHLPGDDGVVVSYHLGEDSASWVVTDANATELFTAWNGADPTMTQNGNPAEPTSLLGRWELTGFFEEDAGHLSGSYPVIFRDTSAYAGAKFTAASGETLTVTETDGGADFTMRGGAKVPWTSAEKEQGVLEPAIEDQDGRLASAPAPHLRMERLVNGRWVSSYSDSDLDMDNRVFTDGETLVLMVTTIVDELYVTKYFYRFSRA